MSPTILLNSGIEMPALGFGVFQVDDASVCRRAVREAIETGYRLVDTARSYGNEAAVGEAIRDAAALGVSRDELFVTSKAFIPDMGYRPAKAAVEVSLSELGLDYIDLYLVHMPLGDYFGSWRALEELHYEGYIRAIGVSNFTSDRIVDLAYNFETIPAVNQLELHPFYQREDELAVLREYRIAPQAWAPFAEGRNGIFTHPVLVEIAREHDCTPAQVILAWNVRRGVAVIPKSVHRDRMAENYAALNVELTDEDMARIAELDLNRPQLLDTRRVSEVHRLYGYLDNPVLTSL